MELFKASNQWATRPPDERFWTLQDMTRACTAYREQARESRIRFSDLRVEPVGDELQLLGRLGMPARLTHWSMGQLCSRAQAPASYLRKLSPTLAAQNLNWGLKHRPQHDANPDDWPSLLFHSGNGSGPLLRAITSSKYTRIWNYEVGQRLMNLHGWRVPPASPVPNGTKDARIATVDDCMQGSQVRPGQLIGPSGIYASDHDMFVFMISDSRIEDGSDGGLFRGFFCWNSEVGASSFGIMAFLFKTVCQNHIVWGAHGVHEMRIRHVGDADERAFQQIQVELKRYADSSASDMQAKIQAAQRYTLGGTKDEVVEQLLGMARKRRVDVTQKELVGAYQIAERSEDQYGAPTTLWGMVNGLTEQSQQVDHTDNRVKKDKAAGKLLQMAF